MSIQRVLEPEVMESFEEAMVYDAMNHDEVNRQFVNDLIATGFTHGDVLDLGTGTALIPVELCLQIANARVMAIDLSDNMLNIARNNVELSADVDRIQLDRVDAKSMPYAENAFDCAMSNSIIHHLPDPESVIAESIRVVRSGGIIFFRDLLRPDQDARVGELVARYAGEEPDQARRMFADSLRAALTLEEVREMVAAYGFAADTVRATSDRHWTWTGMNP